MNLEDQIKKRETDGYIPIFNELENYYFFLKKEDYKDLAVGTVFVNEIGAEYKITHDFGNGRFAAIPDDEEYVADYYYRKSLIPDDYDGS